MNLAQLHNRWIAVQVSVGREFRTAMGIKQRGYEEFVPTYQHRNRTGRGMRLAPLFGGYVFVRFDAGLSHPILNAPGVVRLVGTGPRPTPIDDGEIEALKIVMRSGRRCGPCAVVEIGQHVEIMHGALCGLRGRIIRWKNQDRLVISVGLLRQSVLVELDSCDVTPVRAWEFVGVAPAKATVVGDGRGRTELRLG